jgi:hypothetical protein
LKILLDHNVDQRLRHHFRPEDEVYTTGYPGWQDLLNGDLMEAAQKAAFTVLVTTDGNVPYQQNLALYGLTVIVLNSHPNRRPQLLALMPKVIDLLNAGVEPGRHYEVMP